VAKTTIHSPQDDYTGDSTFGDGTVLQFEDGKAEYDGELSDAVRGYLRGAGYGINSDPAEPEEDLDPPDPRDVGDGSIVGTPLRDAAVDPHPDDFLPPVNAGKDGPEGNPHGSNVVAPEIHAAGDQIVVPGPVGTYVELDNPTINALTGEQQDGKLGLVISDPEVQQQRESEYAERALIGNGPVGEVVADMGGVRDSLTPAGADLKGKALDEALEARSLPKNGTAEEKRQRVADYDAEYGSPEDIPGAQSTADVAAAEGLEGDDDDAQAAAEQLEG